MLPLMGLWFTLGSYEVRQGLHVLWFSALILLAAWSVPGPSHATLPNPIAQRPRIAALAAASVFIVMVFVASSVLANYRRLDLSDGQKLAFARQTGADTAAFFAERIKVQSRIWTTSNYSYGLFYGRLPLGRPIRYYPEPGLTEVATELLDFRADYAISAGRFGFGLQSALLPQLAQRCPLALQAVLTSRDSEFTYFSVNHDELRRCVI